MEWQPIESAPIDTPILVWTKESFRDNGKLVHVCVEEWDGKKLSCEFIMDYKATHWMPLPEAPNK